MAKKPRTPPPPRRVQAPKTRSGDGRRGAASDDMGARQRTILYAVAGSGIVALIVVVILVVVSGGGSSAKDAVTTIRNEGCQYKKYPALPRTPHYTSLTPSPAPKWNSFPPTSGRHYYQPVPFNLYTEPPLEIQLVHNLEHGAVILQYGDKVPKSQVDDITAWYQKDANGVVVAPLPKLGDKVALTAWTDWTECTGFDAKAATAFRKAFRYQAPEKFPKSYLEPGQ